MSHEPPRDPLVMEWVRKRSEADAERFDTDAAWERFRRERAGVVPLKRRRMVSWQLAAAIIILAAALYIKWPRSAPLVERVAANGEHPVVTLEDGTRITLNGGSRLRYPSKASGDRDLYLEGEALFEVKHDPRRELRVHAANSLILDVGTKFTVRAYPNQDGVHVAVLEGVVDLTRDKSAARPVRLLAGDVGTIDSTGTPTKLSGLSDRYAGWTTGALVFDNVTLREAVVELEHRYGVHVIVADNSLAAKPVVARFHGESIQQVLDALSLALGAHYDRSGTTYTIARGAK